MQSTGKRAPIDIAISVIEIENLLCVCVCVYTRFLQCSRECEEHEDRKVISEILLGYHRVESSYTIASELIEEFQTTQSSPCLDSSCNRLQFISFYEISHFSPFGSSNSFHRLSTLSKSN